MMTGNGDQQTNRKRTFSGRVTGDNMHSLTPGRRPVGLQTNQFLGTPSTNPVPPPPVYPLLVPQYYFVNPSTSLDPIQHQFNLMGLNQSPLANTTGTEGHPAPSNSNKVAHIGVFWDIENCGVPRGKSAMVVVQMIRDRFYGPNYIEAEFITVCDIRKESAQVIQELNDAQVTVIHVAGISKNAADDKLGQAMRRYADAYTLVGRSQEYAETHGNPAILLISGDVNFASDLSDLRHRKRLHVILLHNPHAPEALLACAHEHHDFHKGLEGIPNRGTTETGNGANGEFNCNQSHDVMLLGLPSAIGGVRMNKLKSRLNRLSDNCGGKVVHVENQQALIRFKSRETALRAAKRMNGEDVLGSKVRTLSLNNFGFYSAVSPQVPIPNPMTHQLEGQLKCPPTGPLPPMTTSDWNMWTSPSLIPTNTQERKVGLTPKKKQNQPLLPVVKIKEEPKEDHHSTNSPSSSSPKSYQNGREGSSSEGTTDSNGGTQEEVENKLITPQPELVEVAESDSSRSYSSSADETLSNPPNVAEQPPTLPESLPSAFESPPNVSERPPSASESPPNVSEQPPTPPDQLPRVNLLHVVTEFESFGCRLKEILIEEGSLELDCLLAKYTSIYGPLAEVDEEKGVPLEHLLNSVKGVRIKTSAEGERLVTMEMKEDNVGKQSHDKPSAQLRVEITNLLKTFPRCTVPIWELPTAYREHYDKELELTDEIKGIVTLLDSTVHLMGKEPFVYLTLRHDVQMKRFAVDVLRILKWKERKEISLKGFNDSYLDVTGRVFESGYYGMCSLRDLLRELMQRTSHITLIQDGDETLVQLVES